MFTQNLKKTTPPSDSQRTSLIDGLVPLHGESKVLVALFILASTLAISLLANLILLFNNRALATRGKIYVQTPDGFTIQAQEFNQDHREAKVIKQTVATWIQLTFEWDNTVPGNPELLDEGFEVGGVTVPTKAYLASYLMEDGFRTSFLQQLAALIPSDVYSGSRKSVVRFFSVSNPRQIATGRWEVDVVSTRIERVNNVEDKEVAFNRTITVQAIPAINLALEDDDPLAWRQRVYELAQNGLIITDVVPLRLSTHAPK
ncbi:MAG: hypothetical protein AAGE59_26715 [Cyanobacteria bacterium P01_F01_bin.86]